MAEKNEVNFSAKSTTAYCEVSNSIFSFIEEEYLIDPSFFTYDLTAQAHYKSALV